MTEFEVVSGFKRIVSIPDEEVNSWKKGDDEIRNRVLEELEDDLRAENRTVENEFFESLLIEKIENDR